MHTWKKVKSCILLLIGFGIIMMSLLAFAAIIDKVIVVVNDEVLTQREFDRAFAPVEAEFKKNLQGEELKERLEEARKYFLENIVNSKLAVSLAKQDKVEIDEAVLQERINKVKGYYDTNEEFLQALNEKGTNLSEFEKEVREKMLAQKILEKEVSSKINVTPSEIQEVYGKNKDKFVVPEGVKVRGIMVRKKEVSSQNEERRKIDAILEEVKGGRDFAELAKEKSEGPYADRGGDMGFVARGSVLKEIEDAVFPLKKGEISPVVETKIGYHIFLAEQIEEPRTLELKEVSDYIKEQIFNRKFGQELSKWFADKRKNAYISYK